VLEVLLVLLFPLVVLWLGWRYTTRKLPMVGTISNWLLSVLKWLWKDRREKSKGGQMRTPRTRYYDD